MCGIAGIAGLDGQPVSIQEVSRMCGALVHRGPNDEGYYVSNGIALGHKRLSIIDLETGRQPVRNEDGSIWVVFNGEIYNFKELRDDLRARGHKFYTASDTETIVHLYEEHGRDCVKWLRGMFAIALWDDRSKTLFLARDRLGIKPLYFGEFGRHFCFASEVKALLQFPEVDRDLDWSAVSHLFTFLTTPPANSLVSGIKKLEPGHTLMLQCGRAPDIRQYWDVNFDPDYRHDQNYFVENVRELLQESVRLRMISDVPLGAFLSGGIDSSSVVATMSRLSSNRIKTFSIGFKEEEYNEATHARAVADHLGTEHRELILEPDVIGILQDLPWYLDEPFGDPSAIPTYIVSRLAADDVTVVLTGDGGDELFAGYDKYLVEQQQRKYQQIPSAMRKMLGIVGNSMREGMKGRNFLRHMALEGAERYIDSSALLDHESRGKLFSREVTELLVDNPWAEVARKLAKYDEDWLSAIQYLDFKHYLPLDILTKVDRMSMAASIEARVPFLDHKLVEFAATIPPELRLHNGSTKHILKRAMQDLLPDSIINRQKQGFGVPLGNWFRGQLHDLVRELLLSPRTRQRGIFNHAYVEQLLHLHDKGRPLELQLWTLISFELWCRKFLDERGQIHTRSLQTKPGTLVQCAP